jgi:putative aldouronate transport system substrate-binding protein
MKRTVFLCMVLILGSAFLFAGGGSQQSSAGSGKPQISVIMFDRGQCAASEGSYEDNRWTRWINENSPVRVSFVPVPRTESTARTTALFAAGQAPDLVWEFGKGFMDTMYNQGVIQPVGDHIKNYSTVYRDYLAAHPELMPFLMGEDGKQYGMTTARNILNIPNHAMWIRQDWLAKFNMPTPVTTDQVLTFMRRVRDEDPDGNGVKDTWGLGFNYNWTGIINALFGQPMDNFMIVNDHFVDWTTTQGYRENLAFKALLYREGLIDPEYITDNNFAKQREYLVTGKTGVWMGSWDQGAEWREMKTNVPSADWQPLEPWTTSQGKQGLFQEPPAHYMVLMNASS